MAGGFIRPEDVSAVQAFMAACANDWEDTTTCNTWEDDRKEGADPMHGRVVEWDLSNIGEEYKWSIDYRLERSTFFKALLNVLRDPARRARAVQSIQRGPTCTSNYCKGKTVYSRRVAWYALSLHP
jgi:hypothetical protein